MRSSDPDALLHRSDEPGSDQLSDAHLLILGELAFRNHRGIFTRMSPPRGSDEGEEYGTSYEYVLF